MSTKQYTRTATYIKVTLLMVSIPLANKLGYYLGSFIHEPTPHRHVSMDFYEFTIAWMILLSAIFFITICYMHDHQSWTQTQCFILHIAYCIFIYGTTRQELGYRPYEHWVLIIACWTTVLTRPILDYIFYKLLK